jgi:Domain of unknown function (DUF1772)
MVRKAWSFVTLVLVALNMGSAFAHVLELPAKMRLDGPSYLLVQGIYRGFGAAGAMLEPSSVLAAAVMTALHRQRRSSFVLGLAGTASLASALAAWLALVSPMNDRMAWWTRETIPDDWSQVRDQWEYTHAARFILQCFGFSALLLSVMPGDVAGAPSPAASDPVPLR